MFRAVIVHQFISSLCRSVVCIWYWIYHKHITAWPRPWHYLLICAWYWLHLCSLQNNIKQKYKQSKKHYNTISHKTRELDQAWQNNISLVYTFKYLITIINVIWNICPIGTEMEFPWRLIYTLCISQPWIWFEYLLNIWNPLFIHLFKSNSICQNHNKPSIKWEIIIQKQNSTTTE